MDESGKKKRKSYLVSWVGYPDQTWEAAATLEGCAALDVWEKRKKN